MIRIRHLLAGLIACVLLAIALPVAGVIPIEASRGHWRATSWLLDFVKRRSVNTYSRQIVAPPLNRADWISRGAGFFESGCRPCHGSPLSPRPPMVMRMTPHPPELPDRVARWDDRELFQIVKHGIKFTAMPAWTAPERADELWSMVAFLRALPSLTPETYRPMAWGDTTPIDGITPVERCVRCHGTDGLGRGGAFPVLAGQRAEYLTRALQAYREDRRHSGFMRPEAVELDARAREEVVAYFSALPRPAVETRAGGLIHTGDPSRQIPACLDCHGANPLDRNPAYPLLLGQHSGYIYEQLVLFRENRRGGSEFAPIMQAIALRLTEADMRAAAAALSGSRP